MKNILTLLVPTKIDLEIFEDHIIIKGPLGILKKKKTKNLELTYNKETRILSLQNSSKLKHFYLSTINKLILGVLKGYTVKLQLNGIGYKAQLHKPTNILIIKMGKINPLYFAVPKDINVKILIQRSVIFTISGIDYQRVTDVAARLRATYLAEPYKGKGFKYLNEIIVRKQGKKTNV